MKNCTLVDVTGPEGVFVDGDWIESKDQDPNGEVRLIQLADVGDGNFIDKSRRYLTLQKAKELKCTFLEPGDVLIARMPDPIGRACIFPGLSMPCVTVVDVCIVRPNKEIADPKWLQYLINSDTFRNSINQYVTGTTRQRISRGNLKKIAFEVPSIEQQQKVIALLDQAEALRSKRRESMELLDQYVRSVFMEMFGDPMTNPKDWQMLPLRESISDIVGGKSLAGEAKDILEPDEMGVLKVSAVTWGKFNPKEFKAVKKKLLGKVITPKKGDLLFSRANTRELVAATSIVDADYPDLFLPDKLWRIDLKNDVCDKHYFDFLLHDSGVRKSLTKTATGTSGSMLNISMQKLRAFSVPIPPIDLQKKFAKKVLDAENIRASMEHQTVELENQFNALMQQAFA